MPLLIRAARSSDIPHIVPLLLDDARARERLDPGLWAVAPDAAARIATSLATIDDPITGPIRHLWMVAEHEGEVVAVAHGANLPAPPIIDLGEGTAGILLDDSHLGADAAVAATLIARTEAALQTGGAVLFVAASPAAWTARTKLLENAGYHPTTLYLAKNGLDAGASPQCARRAKPGDVDAIVQLSALHRAQLQRANPVFWNIHAQADDRFRQWMIISQQLPDRAMFVSGPVDAADGFIIAQPGSPLHIPPAHDVSRIGLVDDFYALAFETQVTAANAPAIDALVDAAEAAFCATGVDSVMAICPVRMAEKLRFLEARGFSGGNLWKVKTLEKREPGADTFPCPSQDVDSLVSNS